MRRTCTFAMGLLGTGLIASAAFSQAPPPVAPVRPVTDDYYGTKIVDNYRYMENLKDPEVLQWMKSQADYTRATLDSLPALLAGLPTLSIYDLRPPPTCKLSQATITHCGFLSEHKLRGFTCASVSTARTGC